MFAKRFVGGRVTNSLCVWRPFLGTRGMFDDAMRGLCVLCGKGDGDGMGEYKDGADVLPRVW